MTNPRIEQVSAGITRERIAVQTHMFYDPMTKTVSISFQAQPWLYVNDVPTCVAGDYETLSFPLSTISGDKFDAGIDPETGINLNTVSVSGVEMIVMAAFATKWDQTVAAETAAAAALAAAAASEAATTDTTDATTTSDATAATTTATTAAS